VVTSVSDDAENGRGLLLVQAVSAHWGWQFPQELGGKVVWAQVRAELRPYVVAVHFGAAH
jgi:hypothetical protein